MKEKQIPQDIDAEQAVLGSMFMSKYALQKAVESLRSDLFYLDAHSKIFSVMSDLSEKKVPVDIMTVSAELKKENF